MNDTQALRRYAKDINNNLRSRGSTEHTHRPAHRDLLNYLAGGEFAFNEGRTEETGNPDFVIKIRGLDTGYVECKDVNVDLDAIESDSDSAQPSSENGKQLKRYRNTFENLLFTNYHEFRWFRNGTRRGQSVRLLAWDGKQRVRSIRKDSRDAFQLIRDFLGAGPQPVGNSRELAERLAAFTRQVRDEIAQLLENDRASEYLCQTKDVFESTLIPELSNLQFADMYAQTLAYGLFVARINHAGDREFDRTAASRTIPHSIPFLRRVFDSLAGLDLDDEPYVGIVDDMAHLLRSSDMPSVLRGFGTGTDTEDPVQHFYETFLAHYDPEMRERRGVYYTPRPVVSYIVRSVDRILRSDFGCADGLADKSRIEYHANAVGDAELGIETREAHKVLVLDPACGTGTFIRAVVELVRGRVITQGGLGMWRGYVQRDLLPRLFGFELMMAPYTVAHFNLWLHLQGQGDMFVDGDPKWDRSTMTADDRIGVYLTNSLDPSPPANQTSMDAFRNEIVSEAREASRVKNELPIMVVIGNPPYSGHSANDSDWINDLIRGKDEGNSVGSYFEVDGAPLKERNSKWISDDYVKFIRFGQWRIEQSGTGVLAFVTNHAWIDNPTFRGMRQSLLSAFDEIYVYDLHGNTRKGERDTEGRPDENVFDILQGVAISIFVKHGDDWESANDLADVFHAELFGDRDSKYSVLTATDVNSTTWRKIEPSSPAYLFIPQDTERLEEYNKGFSIADIFNVSSVGITTARDKLSIHFTRQETYDTMRQFASLSPEDARSNFDLPNDTRDWRVTWAQTDVLDTGIDENRVISVLHRPFDKRYMYYTGHSRGIICMPRPKVTDQMISGTNLGLVVTRGIEFGNVYEHVFCVNTPITLHSVNMKESNHLYPLYLYSSLGQARSVNLTDGFVRAMSSCLKMEFVDDGLGDLDVNFGPEDILNYIYGILHCPTYRIRYIEFLKGGFPRIPLTRNLSLFRDVAMLGNKLKSAHLMKSTPRSTQPSFPVEGDDRVDRVRYETPRDGNYGRVYINSTQYFDGVSPEIWDMPIGGYQPAGKWLRDRRGRVLTYEEKSLFMKICGVLGDTRELMSEIDATVDQHGGWPLR